MLRILVNVLTFFPCSFAEGVAVDWISLKIYFTDTGLNIIGVIDARLNYKTVIEDIVAPRSIVVDPINR